VIAALIQEVISVYPYLSGNIEMNSNHSNRCCNALALLQCVASHPSTRGLFLKAYIPLFLYPFLNTELNSRPFEYLRLTSLGVIGALVKHPHPNVSASKSTSRKSAHIIPDSEVTEFLVKTEAIPLCLHIMEYGNELSQTVATFIIQKILLDDYGLNYVCKTSDRFFAISQVLTKMIQGAGRHEEGHAHSRKKPSKKLIKHVVRCYLRLCDDNRAYLALHSVLPKYLQSSAVEVLIGDDESCLLWLKQLRAKHKESLLAQQQETQRRKRQQQQSQSQTTHQQTQHSQHSHTAHSGHSMHGQSQHSQVMYSQQVNVQQAQLKSYELKKHHSHSQHSQQQQIIIQQPMQSQHAQSQAMRGAQSVNPYSAQVSQQQQQQQQAYSSTQRRQAQTTQNANAVGAAAYQTQQGYAQQQQQQHRMAGSGSSAHRTGGYGRI